MTIGQNEFEAILMDRTKQISSDVEWTDDEDHSPARVFRVEVDSEQAYPLILVGRYNPAAGKLSFNLIHRVAGRIYGLDLGADHRNPDGTRVGDKHKHRWRIGFRDKEAYVPTDISDSWDKPVEVWKQFCREARITHAGHTSPPPIQEELPL